MDKGIEIIKTDQIINEEEFSECLVDVHYLAM